MGQLWVYNGGLRGERSERRRNKGEREVGRERKMKGERKGEREGGREGR